MSTPGISAAHGTENIGRSPVARDSPVAEAGCPRCGNPSGALVERPTLPCMAGHITGIDIAVTALPNIMGLPTAPFPGAFFIAATRLVGRGVSRLTGEELDVCPCLNCIKRRLRHLQSLRGAVAVHCDCGQLAQDEAATPAACVPQSQAPVQSRAPRSLNQAPAVHSPNQALATQSPNKTRPIHPRAPSGSDQPPNPFGVKRKKSVRFNELDSVGNLT
jgi:hypothetical protein